MDETEIEQEERLRELVKELVRNLGLGSMKHNSMLKYCMLVWKFLMIRGIRLDVTFSSMGCVLIFRACSSENFFIVKFDIILNAIIRYTVSCHPATLLGGL